MSEASRAREAARKPVIKPVKFLLVNMTPVEGRAAVTFNTDMTGADLKAVLEALPHYIEMKAEQEYQRTIKLPEFVPPVNVPKP